MAFQTFLIAAPSVEYWKAVERFARGHHLREQRLQQFHVLVDVLDQGNGLSDSAAFSVNSMKLPPKIAARLLVGAADVDDPDARAGAEVGGGDLVQQQRLARADVPAIATL